MGSEDLQAGWHLPADHRKALLAGGSPGRAAGEVAGDSLGTDTCVLGKPARPRYTNFLKFYLFLLKALCKFKNKCSTRSFVFIFITLLLQKHSEMTQNKYIAY